MLSGGDAEKPQCIRIEAATVQSGCETSKIGLKSRPGGSDREVRSTCAGVGSFQPGDRRNRSLTAPGTLGKPESREELNHERPDPEGEGLASKFERRRCRTANPRR